MWEAQGWTTPGDPQWDLPEAMKPQERVPLYSLSQTVIGSLFFLRRSAQFTEMPGTGRPETLGPLTFGVARTHEEMAAREEEHFVQAARIRYSSR